MHKMTLTDDDCFAVRQAARRISQFYERYLSRAGVTPSQYSILALLRDRPGLTMATLSTVLVIERTALLRARRRSSARRWWPAGSSRDAAARRSR